MRKLLFIFTVTMLSCNSQPQVQPLFNGQNLQGWHIDVPDMDNDPNVKSPFIVRDGKLVSLGTPRGHLITDAVFQDYRKEYNITLAI